MTEVEIQKIREKLKSLRKELQEMDDSLKETSEPVELDQTRVGRLSRMDAMQSQQMALESVRRKNEKLVKIQGAMQRIESGNFGYCFICDDEIGMHRLLIDPTSTRCMKCIDA